MLVNTSTDDFLCACSHESIFRQLKSYLSDFFGLTCKTGNQLSYLNIRIYQSSAGISFDQTDHIQEIIHYFFSPDTTECLKDVHRSFYTDNQFDIYLAERLPAITEQLVHIEHRYKESIPKIMKIY